jgi:hypothetical protein
VTALAEYMPPHLLGAAAAEPADLVGAELYGIAGDVAEAVENRREDWLEIRDMTPHPADDPAQRRVVMLAEGEGGREVEITVRLTGRLYAVPGEASC